MKLKQHLIALGAAAAFGLSAVSAFAQVTVGVSWSNFQEERWKTDEAAIKAELMRAVRLKSSWLISTA
jgi:D-xylose transport system substrate-binding protein